MSGFLKLSASKKISKLDPNDFIVAVGDKNIIIKVSDFISQLNIAAAVGDGAPLYYTGNTLPTVNNSGQPLIKGNWVIVPTGTFINTGGGSDIIIPVNNFGVSIFDGTKYADPILFPLPEIEGTDFIEEEEIPKGKAVISYVDFNINKLKQDVINFQLGGSMDITLIPELTDGRYISRTGGLATTVATAWSATSEFLPLYGAKKLEYFGDFGNNSTSLVFYSGTNIASRVLVVPEVDETILNREFDVPAGARYYRVTCRYSAKSNFKIILKGVSSKVLNLQSFRITGAPVYANDVIKQANIIWNDGSAGVVIYDNWNEDNLTYTSFVATSLENSVSVTQPPVVFNNNNQITNYPNFIINSI